MTFKGFETGSLSVEVGNPCIWQCREWYMKARELDCRDGGLPAYLHWHRQAGLLQLWQRISTNDDQQGYRRQAPAPSWDLNNRFKELIKQKANDDSFCGRNATCRRRSQTSQCLSPIWLPEFSSIILEIVKIYKALPSGECHGGL